MEFSFFFVEESIDAIAAPRVLVALQNMLFTIPQPQSEC